MEINATINYLPDLLGKLLGFVFQPEHNPSKTHARLGFGSLP